MTGASPQEGSPGRRRPVSIFLTVACAFAGLADLQAAAFSFSPPVRAQFVAHPWVPAVVAALAVAQIAALLVLWRGRRAGLFAYLALAVVHSAVMLAAGAWRPTYLVWPVVVSAAGAWSWNRLR